MKYYIVISPTKLIASVIEESRNIQKKVYSQKGEGIYFRVKTKQKLDNPRRLFFKGDGRVVEVQVKPHLSLVHRVELDDFQKEIFIADVKKNISKYKKFYINPNGTGNYNQDFTFFLRFKTNKEIINLRSDLLQISKRFLTEEEYRQQTSVNFVPHITILYDDIDPEAVKKAQVVFNKENFKSPILIDNIQIWEVTPQEQKVVEILKLQ